MCVRLIVSLCGLALLTLAPAASNGVGQDYPGVLPKPLFGTPNSAVYCDAMPGLPPDERPYLFCWTPNDGWAVALGWNRQRAYTGYYTKRPGIVHDIGVLKGYAPRARILRFGERWRYRCGDPNYTRTCGGLKGILGFWCISRSTGLTCVNGIGRGFWIGRFRGYRLF